MFSRCLPLLLLFVAPAAALGTGFPVKVPKDFGTIQAAIDAAADGDIIEVSAGHYVESVVIEGFTGLVLRGKGKVVIHSTGAAALTLVACTDCVVDKIGVEGGPGHGIRVQYSEGCTVSKCRVADVAGDGVRLEACIGIAVDRCTIRDVGTDAIAFAVGDVQPTDDCTLTKNKCFSPGDDGICISGSGNLVEGNLVHKALSDGLEMDVFSYSANNVFLGNRVIKAGGVGIYVTGGANQVRDNKVVKSAGHAVMLATGSDHVVEANKLSKAGHDAILVASGVAGAHLLDNMARKAGQDGIEVDGSGAIVEGNTITGAAGDGLRIMGDLGFYSSNTANGGEQDGFHLVLGANGNMLTLNEAHNNKGFDLHDESGASSIAADNDFGSTSP
jgi:parallel beta-helix repeat protein